MDSDFTYQSAYIWKLTAQDGLLPVTNFTEEVKEDGGNKKKSKQQRHQNKEQLGEITHLDQDEDEEHDDDEGSNNEDRICEEEKEHSSSKVELESGKEE